MFPIHNIVLMKRKPGVSHDDVGVRDGLVALLALREQIAGIDRREYGWSFNSVSKSFVFRREAAGSAPARQGEATTTRMI